MKNISFFIKEFLQKSGNYILFATLISRLFSFMASWFALLLLPEKELGLIIYAFSIISFLIPLGGLGAQQSLLRYGSFLLVLEEKIELYQITLQKGIKWSFYLIIGIIILSPIITYKLQESTFYLILLSFSILSYFLFENLKIKYRILYNNKMVALMDITFSVILLTSVLLMSSIWGVYGYVFSLIASPLITFIIFKSKDPKKSELTISLNFINNDFWSYGFYASLSNVATQLLFAIDLILIGYLLVSPEQVTQYKYVSIIPFGLLILPNIVISTDFVSITQNINNRYFIKNYIKNFLTFFLSISFVFFSISYFFSAAILRIFGENYRMHSKLFIILIIGVIGILLLRSLFGNLLSAIGKARLNFWIASISLITNIILNYYFIPTYGILGAGITSAIIMWFSGILSMILFIFYYKKTEQVF